MLLRMSPLRNLCVPLRLCGLRAPLTAETQRNAEVAQRNSESLQQLNPFTILRHVYVPTKLLLDVTRHRVGGFRFAVSQESSAGHTVLHAPEPTQNLSPICVC